MSIQKHYPIGIDEINSDNLFFSAVRVAKEKGLLEEAELIYVDRVVNLLLSDSAKTSGKSYIKKDTAKELLQGIFRVVDSAFDPSNISEIISCIKERRLENVCNDAVKNNASFLQRIRNNVYHLEHLNYKYPLFNLQFAIRMKQLLTYTDIYRFGGENTEFIHSFCGISTPAKIKEVSDRIDILCAMSDLMCRMSASEIATASEKAGLTVGLAETTYSLDFISRASLSAVFCNFYGFEGVFLNYAYYNGIRDLVTELSLEELSCELCDYLKIFMLHHSIEINERNNATTEIERLYACVIADDYISLKRLAKYLAEFLIVKLRCGKKLEKILFFS